MPIRSDTHAPDAAARPAAGEIPQTDRLLARAVVWRFLALGLSPHAQELRRAPQEAELRALASALSSLGLPAFPCDEGALPDLAPDDVFSHTLRGSVCLYETEYAGGPIFQQAHELADLQGCYAAFGLQRRTDKPERADHIAVQCEFIAFLAMKQAYASESGDAEQQGIARDVYRSFLRDHLARFGVCVADRLGSAAPPGFYRELAALLRRVVTRECRRLGLRAGPQTLPLRLDDCANVPADCGEDEPCASCEGSGRPGSSGTGPSENERLRLARGVRR